MRVNMEVIQKLLSKRSRFGLLVFTLLFAFIWLFPPNYLYFLKGLSSYLPLHVLMETFSIIVAAIIFAVGWEAYIKEKTGNLVIIATVFLAVVFIDFAHMLSFAGMPAFVTPANPEKAIFFWLCGRFFVAFGMLYIAVNAWKPLKSYAMHYIVLALSLLATAIIYWIGLWHQDILPHTFIPGHGLTPLKIYLEWSVVAILVVAAVFMMKKKLEKKQEYDAQNILMAIYLMILSEIFFMLYADVADLYNFMGHVYKVIAYYYLYRAIFAENIQKPYRELEEVNITLSDLYNNAPCGYHSIDKDGVFIRINDTELSWLGYSREEVVGKMKFLDIVTPRSLELFKENFPGFKERGWVKDLEFELVRKDATIFSVLASATAIKDNNGNYLMSRSTLYDITELRKVEETLGESEEKYRTLIQNIQAAVVVHGADTQILTSNRMAQELLGLTENQLLGKTAIDPAWHFSHEDGTVMPPEEYPANKVVATRQPLRNFVVGVHRPDKENDVWVLVNADPVFTKENEILQVVVTFIDITELVRAERELRESEEKFSAAFHSSPNLMVITRVSDGTILDVNEGYSRLLGYSREESIGKTTASLSIWADPADRATFVASLEKYGQITDFETTLRRKGGTIISVIDSARTIQLQGETCILSVVYDITERKQVEQERLIHLQFVENMDKVNLAIQGANDLNQMMSDVLDVVLSIFNCDRAYIVYPCDTEAASYHVPMERTRAEYPGALAKGLEVPIDTETIRVFRTLMDSDNPVTFGPGSESTLPPDLTKYFGVQSQVAMVIYPKIGKPYMFGLHQCSHARIWTPEEKRLLKDIGRRLSDALTSLVMLRNLRESEWKYREIFDNVIDALYLLEVAEDGRFRTIEVNPSMEKLTGIPRSQSVGKTQEEVVSEETARIVNAKYRHCVETGYPIEEEVELDLPTGKHYFHSTLIPARDEDGHIRRIVGISRDITERKQAEMIIQEKDRHSQSLLRLSKNLELAQTYMQVIDAARDEVRDVIGYQNLWVFLLTEDKKYAHAMFASGAMSERTLSEEGAGKLTIKGDRMLEEIVEAKDIVVVEDARIDPRTDKKMVALMGNRTIINVPIIFFDKHIGMVGTGTYGDEGIRPPTLMEKEYLRALSSHLAVTLDRIHLLVERKKAEQEIRKLNRIYHMLSDCNQSLVRADDENKLVSEVCKIITDRGGYRMAWVGYAQDDEEKTVKPVAYAGHEEGYLNQRKFSWGDNEYGRGLTGTAIRTGKYNTALNYDTDPRFSPWRKEAKKRGYTSSVAFPLTIGGRPFGALSIYGGISDVFNEEELTLLQELAYDLSYGITTIRTRIEREHAQVMLSEAQRITHIGSWELNLIDNVLTWSDEIYRMFEIDPVKFGASYEAFLDAIHPDDREAVNFAYTNSLKTRLPYSIEHRLFFSDGRVKYVKEQCETYYGKDGKPLRSVGTVQDVTELKLAEDALRYLSQRNELILNSAGEGIYGTDVEGNITFINPAALQMLGFSIEELIGKNSHQVFHHTKVDGQPYPANECPLYRSLKEGGIHRGDDEVFWTKNGEKFYVEHINTPLLEEGEIVGAVVVFRDITERKLAQEGLHHAYAYNRSLIEASLDPLVTISPDGKITDVNAATEIVTGRSRNELVGTDFSDYFSEPEKAKAGYHQVFEVGFVKDYSLEIKHKDGHLTPVIYNASVYRDEEGKITGVFAAARDITKLKAAEMALHELNDNLELLVKQRTSQLEVANKELEAFTYSVSHDLRAPLRAIDGFSTAVMEDYGDKVGEDGKDYLQRVRSASQKMSTLIDDLLSLSRLTRGELSRVSTNLSDIASEVIKTLSEADPDRHVEVSIADNMMNEADPHFMEIVFTNLLNNAWKFTSKKGKAKIEFNVTEKDGKKVYYIKDNGAGFDMNYSVKLFQPFQRLHTAEEFPGTGIGLATVYRIIKKHGGEIWAEGKVDEGATFYFTLGG